MKINFYITEDQQTQTLWLFACRLIEKAYLAKHQIFVYFDSQEDAYAFDELLWTFHPESFIPHHIQGEGPSPPPEVQLGFQPEQPSTIRDICVNLSTQIPPFYQQFARVFEFVPNQETQKVIKREHYKFYKMQNLNVTNHHITSSKP